MNPITPDAPETRSSKLLILVLQDTSTVRTLPGPGCFPLTSYVFHCASGQQGQKLPKVAASYMLFEVTLTLLSRGGLQTDLDASAGCFVSSNSRRFSDLHLALPR